MTFGSNPRRPVRDYAFFCILALGAALRLYHVTAPFLDAHAWRQLDTAAMARNFYEGPFFPLDPRVDWGGRSGYLEAEFPLVPAVIAVLYRLFGLHEILGRLLVIATRAGADLVRLPPRARARRPGPGGQGRSLPDGDLARGGLLRPDRDPGHADDLLIGACAARLCRVRAYRQQKVARDRRRRADPGLPPEVAGCLPRSAYRRRTGARPRMEGVPRPAGSGSRVSFP